MNSIRSTWLVAATLPLGLIACGGGGGGKKKSEPLAPPANLNYGASIAYYLPGVSIPDNVPTVDGTVESFSVSPALPAGLSIDPDTGAITGAATGLVSTSTFTVTATGPLGMDDTSVEIAVVQPPRFAFSASAEDDTISTYLLDPETGILRLEAVRTTPVGEEGPEALIAHPSGDFLYSVNEANTISHYVLDVTSGRLEARGVIATGNGPHVTAVSPSGEFLYVLAQGEAAVYAYAIDPDGALNQVGVPVATGIGPASISIDPEGDFAYVAQELAGSVRTFSIDDTTGALSQAGGDTEFPGKSPVGIAVGPAGTWAFVALSDSAELVPAQVDPVSGALAPTANVATTDSNPATIAVHPTGRFVYTVDGIRGEVEIHTFDPVTQNLTPSTTSDLGTLPAGIRFDASGLFAMVSLPERDLVSIYNVDLATGALIDPLPVPARGGTTSLALTIGASPVTRVAERLYATGEDSADIQAWSIDENTGDLAPLGGSVPVGSRPRSLTFDPLGRFAFAAGAGSKTLHTFLVETDGSLTDTGLSIASDESPRDLAVDPTGRFLYAAIREADVLRSYSIDGITGALTELDEAAAGTEVRAMGLHPTGRFVYGSNFESSDITAYRVEEGMFVEGPFTTIATSRPDGIRFSPRGDRAFVGGGSADILIPYNVDSRTGELTPIPPGKGVGDRPTVIEVHPTDQWAYAAISDLPDGNGYIRFLLVHEESGGFVGGDAGAEISAGLNPTDIRIDPSGRFLYVLNRTGSDLSVFDIDQETGTPVNERRVNTPVTPWSLKMTYRLE